MLWLLGLCVWLLAGVAIAQIFSLNECPDEEDECIQYQ